MAQMHATEMASGLPSPPPEPSSEPIAEISATLLRAQTFLSGCGIALMVREGAWLVCHASSGAAAPEIGARMEVDHSFLGLCLTSKKPQSCEDADSDLRIENVTYSRLRPKSILAVPVRAAQEVIAVLASFSSAPNAFTHTQIAILRTVADSLSRHVQQLPASSPPADAPAAPPQPWASTTRDLLQERTAKPEPQPTTPPAPVLPVLQPREEVLALADELAPPPRMPEPRPTPPTVRVVKLPVPRSFEMPRPRPRRRFRPALLRIVAITAVCLVGALATAGWYSARIADAPRLYTAPIIAPVIQPATHAEPVTARVPEASEPPAKSAAPEPKAHADAPAPAAPQPAETGETQPASREVIAPRLPQPAAAVEPPPTLTLSAGSALPALVAPHAAAPKIHHSHATEAHLEQRVAPQYPPIALSRRIAGQVTLSVLIRNDGSVTDIKVLSGNPLFHTSAVDAVKQWRYSPATLDGEPVEVHAQVVLKFDLPHRR